MSYEIRRSSTLVHYGVPHMSWGKRRYQNPDGSLTPEGREHYGVGESKDNKLEKKYNREYRGLVRLSENANRQIQSQKAEKYANLSQKMWENSGVFKDKSEPISKKRKVGKIFTQLWLLSTPVGRALKSFTIGKTSAYITAANIFNNKSKEAQKHLTEKGHKKAVAEAKAKYEKMLKTFTNTPYEELLKRQHEALKKNM